MAYGNTPRVDPQLLTVLGAVIASTASAIGAVVALDQLTVGARLRRFDEFLRASLSVDSTRRQTEVLRSLHQETVARLVATSAVPGWRLAPEAITWIGALFLALLFGVAGIPGSEPRWGPIGLAVALGMLGTLSARRAVGLLHERRRIADDFIDGGRAPLQPAVEGTVMRSGHFWKQLGCAAALSLGSSLIAVGVGGLIVAPIAAVDPVWFVILGAVIFGGAGSVTRLYLRPRVGAYWLHPHPHIRVRHGRQPHFKPSHRARASAARRRRRAGSQ